MANDLISVIVPVYNCEKYLRQCIDSILEQTYHDFELLLVNDGATDNSGMLCDEYAKKDNRIRVIHKENGGVSSARNRGIEQSRGNFITFVDSDDFVSTDYLQKMHEIICTGGDIAMCKFAYYDDTGVHNANEELPDRVYMEEETEEYINFLSRFLTFSKNIFGSACRVLWRRGVIAEVRFNPAVRVSEDLLFLLQTLNNASTLICTEHVGYFYRVNAASATKSYKKNYLQSQSTLHQELKLLLEDSKSLDTVLDSYASLLCYYVFSNEIKFRPNGWHKNINEARKSELYPYFTLKNGLTLCGVKQKLKYLIIWSLVKIRLV